MAEWTYEKLDFGWLQILTSLAFPVSFCTIALTSTSWHQLHLAKRETLSLWLEIKSAPFFLPLIWMKTFTLATFINAWTSLTDSPYLNFGIVMMSISLPIFYQSILHRLLGFKLDGGSLIGVGANMSSLARASTAQDAANVKKVERFFKVETLTSTLFYLAMSITSVVMAKIGDSGTLVVEAWIGLGIVMIQLIITQTYLNTECGMTVLFSNTDPNELENIQLTTLSPKINTGKAKHKDKRRTRFGWIKWAVVSTSIAVTIAIFVYFTYSLVIKGIKRALSYCQTQS